MVAARRVAVSLALSSCHRLDGAEDNQAYPKIYQHSQVNSWRHVPCWRRQVRHQEEIQNVARQNRNQSLDEVSHS